jgi:hypothetical protein
MMISTEDMALDLSRWVELEQAMIQAYQDDERLRREAVALENIDEIVSERLFIERTRYLLNIPPPPPPSPPPPPRPPPPPG